LRPLNADLVSTISLKRRTQNLQLSTSSPGRLPHLSRGGAQFFTPPPRTAPIVGAHSRRQDPKTPVEQALMRGLGTA
jgi:hypothetical protein